MDELKIVENAKHKTIGEAFGVSEKIYDAVHKAMTMSFSMQTVDEFKKHGEKGHDCSGQSSTVMLSNFLKSKEFAKIKWTPKTANDFFMLGYVFNHARKSTKTMIEKYIEETVTGSKGLLGALLSRKNVVKIEIVDGK